MGKTLRIVYAAGPGNVLGTYRHWKAGRDDPSQLAMTYSGQFYDVCRELDARGLVIACCRTPGRLRDGNFTIIHRPLRFERSAGFLFHLGQFWWGLRLLISAALFRADVAVVCMGTHWFWLWLMRVLRIQVVPTLHCVLWPKYNWKPTWFQRLVRALDGRFFRRGCAAIISVSEAVTQQLETLTGGCHAPLLEFVPQYRRHTFARVAAPDPEARPFRVLFAGRIERNKGVFDILQIAKQLASRNEVGIEFDLCGEGSVLGELQQEIANLGLAPRVRCHGHCDQQMLLRMYSRAHVVLVLTTTHFSEGFNKVVAEGVLAGRPVITSSVCPALDYVREAVVEVPPDNIDAYTQAILDLKHNALLYRSKQLACLETQQQFYDSSLGWAAALRSVLLSLSRLQETAQEAKWLADAGKIN